MSTKVDVIANWSSLLIGFIAPLVAFPYISHTIPQHEFGKVLLYFSISAVFITICEYGFNITATRKIAIASCCKQKILNIVTETVILKAALFSISCLTATLIWGQKYSTDIFCIMLYVLLIAFQPNWFFIGIQKSRYNALYVAGGRLVGVLLLVLNIRESSTPSDVVFYFCIGGMLSLALAWVHLYFECRGARIEVEIANVLLKIRKDFHVSFGAILITLYSSLPAIILAELSGLTEVANYSSTEKVFKSFEYFITTALSVLFPKFIIGLNDNSSIHLSALKKIELIVAALCIPIALFSAYFGSYLFSIYYGGNYDSDPIRIAVFSLIPLFGSLAVLWGNLGLLSISGDKQFFKSILIGSTINVSLVTISSSSFGAVGAGFSLLISTIFIFGYMRYSFWRLINKKNVR
jgi:PST family polysaccharide transporter